jgi:hypothetical protein
MIGDQPYHTITTDKLKVDDVLSQLRAIKEFPCTIKLYDRAFVVATMDECWVLIQGVEVGAFLALDRSESQPHTEGLTGIH